MKRSHFLFGALCSTILFACVPYYIANDFGARTADHRVIAVLPFEMTYSGLTPEGLTPEDMDEIARAESRAFEVSFFHEIQRSTRSGKKPIRVSLQDYQKTWQLLEENHIGIMASWDERPEFLAEILGVDAVVRARIEKYRLMPDLASYGIDIGIHILNEITNYAIWPWLPYGATKSKEINAEYSLMEKRTGEVIWSISFSEDADWRQPANAIIDETNRIGARKFPYRVSKKYQKPAPTFANK